MVLFRSDIEADQTRIAHGSIELRAPLLDDYDAWARLRAQSQAFHQPWEPVWARDELTRSAFKRRIRHYDEDRLKNRGYAFFVMRAEDQELVGGCNLSNVRRGISQTASLGYWVGKPFARKGYISDAVRAVLQFSFAEQGLHRIEAACIPGNEPSRNLLSKCGFHEEGLAKSYLKIAGQWQDHVLFAKLAEDQS